MSGGAGDGPAGGRGTGGLSSSPNNGKPVSLIDIVPALAMALGFLAGWKLKPARWVRVSQAPRRPTGPPPAPPLDPICLSDAELAAVEESDGRAEDDEPVDGRDYGR